mmetsp:Transcript_12812/g.14674  ORF Transcript_12812/g.14674 Transcript_12812/m.14674 type:complete len:97 (+) Transcript_12812:1-291(+)
MVSNSNAEPNNKDIGNHSHSSATLELPPGSSTSNFLKEKSISNKSSDIDIERVGVDMTRTINDTNNERKIMVSNSNGEPNDKDGDDSHSSSGQQEE